MTTGELPPDARAPRPGVALPIRSGITAAAALAVWVALAAWAALPASAHGGEGVIDPVTVAPAAEGERIEVSVRLTYANDGDPVTDGEVFISGAGPEGTSAEAKLEADPAPGVYTGSLRVERGGAWTLTVTSADPPASLTLDPVEVPEPPPTTEAPTTETTMSPEEVERLRAAADADAEEDGTSASTVVLVVLGLVVVVGVVLGLMFWMRGRTPGGGGDPAP